MEGGTKTRDLEKTTIAIIIGAVSAVALSGVSLIAFIIHRRKHPITEETDIDKSYSREFRSSRRSSTNDELYHNNSKKIPETPMEIPFTAPSEFEEEGDPDLIPNKNVKTSMGVGKMYSRLSNGEINQRYGSGTMEKIPLRTLPSDVPLSMEHSMLSNYATFRTGKPNGLGLKPQPQSRRETHHMASLSSSGSFQGKPSSIVVNIDTRLIGQQLASNQLPESCV
ncbi:unnamed protein product [Allacma fusca]|uniref:Uncharacterized protein n=1 Tax=Allacma fusca TaxID=39272 RepID=A0A8J2KZS1_9HEXA|nr:unnamed protein product [Allacma fusca]